MTEELLKKAKARYGNAEVYRVKSTSRPVSFENNRLKEVMSRDQSGVALRVISGGRVGFSSTTDPSRESELVRTVGDLAPFGSEARFEFPPSAGGTGLETYDESVDRVQDTELIAKGKALIAGVLETWPEALCDLRFGRSVTEESILNSSGVEATRHSTSYHLGMGVQLIRGTDMLNVWASHSAHGVFGEEEERKVLGEVLSQLENARNIAEAPPAGVPVLFTPRGVAAALLEPLLSGFNGRNVVTGSSPIIGREGEKTLDSRFSIYDDPLCAAGSGSRDFDDEGVPSRKIGLVVEGVIGEPIFDLQTAGQAGRSTTGSAQRGLASTPHPGMSVIDIAPGDTPYSKLIADMSDGLIVEGLLGAGQGNELGGDFRANVALGYRVRNGEIVGRVKDTMISGNSYTVLDNIEELSDAAEWVYGSLRSPAIRCRGVEVASA